MPAEKAVEFIKRPSPDASFHPGAGGLDERLVLGELALDEGGEALGRHRHRLGVEVGEARAHSGEASASTNALFSRAVDSAGRCAGREDAEPGVDVEARQAEPAPASAIVGTSGIALERVAVVTASAFSLPALMLADAAARLSKLRSTWPASSASCAGLPPAYGMWTM